MKSMNPEAKERLDEILKKSPAELNQEESAFLRARSSYLKPAQLEEYDSVLNPKEEKPVKVASEPKKAKGK